MTVERVSMIRIRSNVSGYAVPAGTVNSTLRQPSHVMVGPSRFVAAVAPAGRTCRRGQAPEPSPLIHIVIARGWPASSTGSGAIAYMPRVPVLVVKSWVIDSASWPSGPSPGAAASAPVARAVSCVHSAASEKSSTTSSARPIVTAASKR